MIVKVCRVLYNAVRFLGKESYSNLLFVSASTVVLKSKKASLMVGKRFRTRRGVEINVRGNATVVIEDNVFMNSGCIITARNSVTIGENTIFGPNVMIFDNDHAVKGGKIMDNEFVSDKIVIGKNVWIGAGSMILKGACVEDGCIIAAGSVVKGRVEKGNVFVQKRHATLIPITSGDNENEN